MGKCSKYHLRPSIAAGSEPWTCKIAILANRVLEVRKRTESGAGGNGFDIVKDNTVRTHLSDIFLCLKTVVVVVKYCKNSSLNSMPILQ